MTITAESVELHGKPGAAFFALRGSLILRFCLTSMSITMDSVIVGRSARMRAVFEF
jgi:hypothetical protein